jgi:alkanesulfonate monooxygenase SsuD/methylene tetrahydromethanopterin reductase-like flavin-dependent oxidoreductase (luciferase family)
VKLGLFLPPFHDFADPRRCARLAESAERAGWDGVFLWDHMLAEPASPVADPWVVLAAMAMVTERVALGTLVTPLARRRPWVLARQVASLDRLSAGRLVLGIGLGDDGWGEFSSFGEPVEPRERAVVLDESLSVLGALLTGEPVHHDGTRLRVDTTAFLPRPVQPRLPLWGACRWPNRRSLARASRLAGCFPIFDTGPGPARFPAAQEVARVQEALAGYPLAEDYQLVLRGQVTATEPAQRDALAAAGATWLLEGIDHHAPDTAAVERMVAAGPG